MNRKKPDLNLAMKRRQYIIGGLFAVFATALCVKAYTIQIQQSAYLQDQGERRFMREQTVKARRGNILDRNGEPMAVSTPVDAVGVIPKALFSLENDNAETRERKKQARVELAKMLHMRESALNERLKAGFEKGRHFIFLKRQMDPREVEAILALELPGVQSRREYRRYYPAAHVAGQLVGFTNVDDKGQEGIEASLNSEIAGKDGAKLVIRNSVGKLVEEVSMVDDVRHGDAVQLSIDLRIQTLLDYFLLQNANKFDAAAASAVVVDAATGEVLAISNVPQFNLNDTSQRKPAYFKNRAITDVFEPGSTVKPIVVAKALEDKKIGLNTVFDTNPGYVRIPGGTIEDTKNHKVLDTAGVVVKSSNVAMTMIADKYSGKDLTQIFKQFGFGKQVQSMVRGESAGILHKRAKWRPIEKATLSFGYGLSTNILQLAQAYTVFANEGRMVPLTFLKHDRNIAGTRILKQETVEKMLPILEAVTQDGGTATKAAVPGFRVGGKTGTTQLLGENGAYIKEYASLFVGIAPMERPRYVMAVVVTRPKGSYYGGTVAAPVFSQTMSEALRLLNVLPTSNPTLLAGGSHD